MQNTFVGHQLAEFGKDGISYIEASKLLKKYVENTATASEISAQTYKSKIARFLYFIFKTYEKPFDTYVEQLKKNPDSAYDLLADYARYLKGVNQSNEVRSKTKRAYKFLRFCGVRLNLEDFQDRVKLPRQEFPDFEGTGKEQIVELLNNCKNLRLKTALMLYAALGPRKTQACAIRNSDVDLQKETITFRADYAKMGRAYTRPMTREIASQIKTWNKFKYRPRPWVRVGNTRKAIVPKPGPDDLLLAMWDYSHTPKPEGIADSIYDEFEELANRLEMQRRNGKRVITFHRLRAFAKSTISDLGYGDYSEFWIGHKHSTYYRKPEKEQLELFRKIEPYLTFVDVTAMEKHQADMQSRLDRQTREYQELRGMVEERMAKVDQLMMAQHSNGQIRDPRELHKIAGEMAPALFKIFSEAVKHGITPEEMQQGLQNSGKV